jgi:hypothetical protein
MLNLYKDRSYQETTCKNNFETLILFFVCHAFWSDNKQKLCNYKSSVIEHDDKVGKLNTAIITDNETVDYCWLSGNSTGSAIIHAYVQ